MLPSVLTLLDFGAGVGTGPAGARGAMPFPFGFLDASETTLPPPPPPPPATPTDPAGASYARFYLGKRKKRRRPDLLQPDERAQLRAVLQSAYDEALGRPREVAAQSILGAVHPHAADRSDTANLLGQSVDWGSILRDARAIETILRAYLKARDEEEDEDLILLLH